MQSEHPDTAGVIAPPPLIYAGSLALGLLLRPFLPRFPLPRSLRRRLAVPLALGGLALGGWGFRTMRGAGTPVDPTEPVTALVSSGPFRYVRNPLYLSVTLLYAGIALLTNTLSALLLLPGLIAVMRHGVIGREEQYLERRFGKDYTDYKKRTPRGL